MPWSSNPFRRLSLFLSILLSSIAGGYQLANVVFNPPPPPPCVFMRPPPQKPGEEIYRVVEQMPQFPTSTCADLTNAAERKSCSDKKLMEYVYYNVKYPVTAREQGIMGIAVVSFVVEKSGFISSVQVARDPGGGLGEEAAKVVRQMQAEYVRWEPGIHEGAPVRVRFNLPVRFHVE